MTSRETAAAVGEPRSNGCMRADGWARLPLIRMTNVSLLPGEQSLDEVFGGVDHAIYMETNRSWSIDDKRYNFQFGCEIGWEIRHGKRVRMLKNPSYSGITTEFWNACAAIAGREHWTLWGVPNCGKGQPEQVMGTGHGASPARFRNIKIGSAYAGLRSCRRQSSSSRWWMPRARSASPKSRPSSARRRRGADALRQQRHPPERGRAARAHLSVRAGDRWPHRARHHQPPGPRRHSRRGGASRRHRAARPRPIRTCCRWPSRGRTRASIAASTPPPTPRPSSARRPWRRPSASWKRRARPRPESTPRATRPARILNSRGVSAWYSRNHGAVFHHRHGRR